MPRTRGQRIWIPPTLGARQGHSPAPPSEQRGTAGAHPRRLCGAYGWPRLWRQLRGQGIRVGKQRVQRLMQEHGIRARGKQRFRVTTTDSYHSLPVAPNLLNRNFTVAAPNQAWTGDITYIPTGEGWLFLAVVIDLFSRRVVGWSMQPEMRSSLVIDALEMAWFRRSPDKRKGRIFHSDRGSQYASHEFALVLQQCGITASMSR